MRGIELMKWMLAPNLSGLPDDDAMMQGTEMIERCEANYANSDQRCLNTAVYVVDGKNYCRWHRPTSVLGKTEIISRKLELFDELAECLSETVAPLRELRDIQVDESAFEAASSTRNLEDRIKAVLAKCKELK